MTSAERITLMLEHKEADRIPLVLAHPWPTTIERWQKEGMPKIEDLHSINQFLGLDDCVFNCGGYAANLARAFPYKVYEETDEYKIDLNPFGVKVKYWKHRYSTHVELEHAVKNFADWKKVKWALEVSDENLDPQLPARCAESRDRGYFTVIGPLDHFWFSFVMLGAENLCIQMALDGDFIHDIYDTFTNFSLEMLDKTVKAGTYFDAVWFFSDLGYKNGPLFSPAFFEEFLEPYYKKFRKWCDQNNKYMFLHSDGNMDKLMPAFVRSGFDLLNPLEAKTGMDVRALKPVYGNDITFFGNINAVVISEGTDKEIEEEVRTKIEAAKPNGGFIFTIDHSTPPGVSLRNNRFMFECARKYASY